MAICVQSHTNVSKQTMFLDGFDIGRPKWCLCRCDLNHSIHEGMDNISNVKVRLKTCNGNVNMSQGMRFPSKWYVRLVKPQISLRIRTV